MIRSLIRPAAIVLLVAAATLPVAADKAKSLYNQGKDAEARQNYEQAYDFYRQAYDLRPKDLQYRASFERLRFLAGASHVHRGQLLREAGKLDEALVEFQKAAEIDSSSFIAQQELKRTQQLIEAAKNPGPRSAMPPPRGAIQKRLAEAQGPVELAAISNVPITLKLTEDTKVIYETIGKLAGINVLFDPDYTSRRIKIELNGVTLEEALAITALESKTFWRPVTPNTIFVAQDNPAKRKDVEQNVIKTFYLANLSQPTEVQDVVNALRQILEISRIQPLVSQGALVVRGTPDQIALATKLVGDLDRSKPEVVVDIAIMQVSRDKAHTLGINPPTSATVALQQNINTTNTTATTGTGNTATVTQGSGSANSINLNALGNLNATDFQVTITPATLTALEKTATITIATVNGTCNSHDRRANWAEARFGRQQDRGDWQFAYTHMLIDREAVMSLFDFSDIRQGSSVQQNRVEAYYQANKSVEVGFTGFFGRQLGTTNTTETELKRLQFDVIYKF